MDSLWAPWRMEYIRAPKEDSRNTFSSKLEEGSDKENLILYRGEHCFVCMNLYPYNNGHLLVVPYKVVDKPENLDNESLSEIMNISTITMKILRERMTLLQEVDQYTGKYYSNNWIRTNVLKQTDEEKELIDSEIAKEEEDMPDEGEEE